jgi:hypothetical protein
MQESAAVISTRETWPSLRQRDGRRTSEEIIREWIARFATNCGQVLSEARVLLWLDEFSHVEPERLEAGFGAVMGSHTINTIPQVGEIHALLDHARQVGQENEAQEDWELALDYCRRYCRPALPNWRRQAPTLPPKIEEAITRAGGFNRLESCPESELQWAKKDFIAALTNIGELQRVAPLLPRGSAARTFLRQLAARSDKSALRSLAPATAAVEMVPSGSPAPDDPIRAECATLRERLSQPEPRPAMTSAEFEARRELLQRQAAQLADAQAGGRKCAISTS